jgi:D-3-phosphoglycerate dehydrogenase
VAPLTVAALKGLLDPILDIPVNYVNAPLIARERRIRVVESKTSRSEDFTSLISIKVRTKLQEKIVAGTIFGKEEPRFVRVNGFSLDAIPEGHVLVIENYDKPGAIGMMGTLLGKRNINIARMHLGRESIGGRAIAFINVDSRVPEDVIVEFSGLPQIISVIQVEF